MAQSASAQLGRWVHTVPKGFVPRWGGREGAQPNPRLGVVGCVALARRLLQDSKAGRGSRFPARLGPAGLAQGLALSVHL